jgi:hypothetical protein
MSLPLVAVETNYCILACLRSSKAFLHSWMQLCTRHSDSAANLGFFVFDCFASKSNGAGS